MLSRLKHEGLADGASSLEFLKGGRDQSRRVAAATRTADDGDD